MMDIEKFKSKVDIVTIASLYTTLERQGNGTYKGLSPFGHEDTASFHIRGDKFHCFSTNTSGDVIDLVKAVEHVSFGEAVKKIKEYVGGNNVEKPVIKKLPPKKFKKLKTKESQSSGDVRTLEERGHDMKFLKNYFKVTTKFMKWCGWFWEYPTFDIEGNRCRKRRKFKDKAVAGKKYHFDPYDKHEDPLGYPLWRIGEDKHVWVVNGEPSVWLCWQYGIPAYCSLSETASKNIDELMKYFYDKGVYTINVLLDNDEAGVLGSINNYNSALNVGFSKDQIFIRSWDSEKYKRGYDVSDLLNDTKEGIELFKIPVVKVEDLKRKLYE